MNNKDLSKMELKVLKEIIKDKDDRGIFSIYGIAQKMDINQSIVRKHVLDLKSRGLVGKAKMRFKHIVRWKLKNIRKFSYMSVDDDKVKGFYACNYCGGVATKKLDNDGALSGLKCRTCGNSDKILEI